MDVGDLGAMLQFEDGSTQAFTFGDELIFDNASALDALGITTKLIDRWQAKSVKAGGTFETTEAVSNSLQNLSRTLRLGLQIAILAVGAYLTLQSSLTAGGIIEASIILGRALAPVERSIAAWKGFGTYVHAKGRLRALFAGEGDLDAEQLPLPKQGPSGRRRSEIPRTWHQQPDRSRRRFQTRAK